MDLPSVLSAGKDPSISSCKEGCFANRSVYTKLISLKVKEKRRPGKDAMFVRSPPWEHCQEGLRGVGGPSVSQLLRGHWFQFAVTALPRRGPGRLMVPWKGSNSSANKWMWKRGEFTVSSLPSSSEAACSRKPSLVPALGSASLRCSSPEQAPPLGGVQSLEAGPPPPSSVAWVDCLCFSTSTLAPQFPATVVTRS